jgi:hypothetical protein
MGGFEYKGLAYDLILLIMISFSAGELVIRLMHPVLSP